MWKVIPDTDELYFANEDGKIKSKGRRIRYKNGSGAEGYYIRKGKTLKLTPNNHGYPCITVKYLDGHQKTVPVHILVARTFIPNPENKPQINHKDGNKKNNCVSNLEWVTASENQMHSRYVLKNRTGFSDTPVVCVETGIGYISTRDAWRKTGINYAHISECANGKRKSAGGYHWRKI